MRSARRNLFRAAGIVLVLAAGPAHAMGVKPSCLDTLTIDTRAWAECTHRFSRNDNHCKPATADMDASMRLCKKKGYSKRKIDAAMARGAATAGKPVKKQKKAPTPATLPKAGSGPIPKVESGNR